MSLEGTLDSFGLPDVLSLLSVTKKSGTLHLRRGGTHGVVHLRDGQVTGARSDVRRHALARRLVGAGLVDDETLAQTVRELADLPSAGPARVLADRVGLDPDTGRELAAEQATDAVFDLLRWTEGSFCFLLDEADPDDLGATLSTETLVAEGRRRLDAWERLIATVPAPDAVVSLVPVASAPPVLTVEEWQLLAEVDGRRTVTELVRRTGRGDFAVVGALAALVERGLLQIGAGNGTVAQERRERLLAQLEGGGAPASTSGGAGVDTALLLRLIAGVKGLS